MNGHNDTLNIPLESVKNLGPKRAQLFKEAGLFTVRDILYYLPRRYEDRRDVRLIKDLRPGEFAVFEGTVTSSSFFKSKRGIYIFTALVRDDSGSIALMWFNQPYLRQYIVKGVQLILSGKIYRKSGLKCIAPEFEVLRDGTRNTLHTRRIVPIYPLRGELTQKWMRFCAYTVLKAYAATLDDPLPTDIRARNKLPGFGEALKNIHFPSTEVMKDMAFTRLIFDEFFIYQLAIAFKRYNRKIVTQGYAHEAQGPLTDGFLENLPFSLSDSQKKAIGEIEKDMCAPRPMLRLLQGEVGSGKTAVIAYAAAIAVQSGYQVAVMAPTEILAEQHMVSFLKFFNGLDVDIFLLTASTTEQEKESFAHKVSQKLPCIAIGTHALLEKKLSLSNAGLIVIDEEHKFGVSQREVLKKKSKNCDLLIVSATPIPRTMALTVYGDMDITSLEEGPRERKVLSFLFESGDRHIVFQMLRDRLQQGHQAYIVCPMIEQNFNARYYARTVAGVTQEYKNHFPHARIATLHGRMSEEEKAQALEDFRNKKTDILVATSIIEVGLDVPTVSVMIVEDAKRFGMSQLHQLRGRIGRSGQCSYFIMVCDKHEPAYERLKSLIDAPDAAEVSKRDFALRGPGEIFGVRQHGHTETLIANPLRDIAILKEARKEAFNLIVGDPALSRDSHESLKQIVMAKFPELFQVQRAGSVLT